jgi:hypothetical protein
MEHPAEIRIQQLSLNRPEAAILGAVHNFSRGGMSIETSVPLMTSSVVQCHVGCPTCGLPSQR